MADKPYHEAAAHEATALPVMLPGKLVGRDQTLATIYGALKQNESVLMYGQPGIGKTAIAATLASAYTQQPGGALWFNVDQDTLAALIVRVGRAYGDLDLANSENPVGMVGAAATLLSQHKPLVVLDGSPLIPAATEFINKIAPGLPVMLLNAQDTPGSWRSVQIPALEPDAAATLFTEKSGLSTPEVRDVVRLLERQPFALVVAAGTARVAKLDAAALLDTLQTASAGDPGTRALQVGLGRLQPALQGILLMLGATFHGSASLELLSMLSGAPAETVQKVMTILAAAGFVQQDKRYDVPYYSLHPLAHSYAQTYLKNAGRLDTLHDKVRDTVLDYARKHTGSSEADHNALAVEMDNFQATSHWAAERGDNDVASQIVVALTQAGDFVRGRGYLYELLQLQEIGSSTASPFPANADVPDDTFAPPALFANLAGDEDDEDDFVDDAVIEAAEREPERPEDLFAPAQVDMTDADSIRSAIASARSEDDDERVQELQEALGRLLRSQGKDNEALAAYSDLLSGYEDADDKPKILATLQTLAEIMVAQANSQAAVHNAMRGARLAEELQDDTRHARMLMLVGDARQQLGESTEAILAYSHALDLAKSQGERSLEADIAMKLGFAQLDDDQTETAIQTWDGALKQCRDLNKRDCEGRILGGLGTAYGELRRWEEAINFHTSALYITREVGDKKEEALQLGNLGYAAKQANRLPLSVIRYRQALHLAYTRNERDNIVSTIVDLCGLLVESPMHLEIAELLITDAIGRDGGDREVVKLKERVNNEKMMAASQGVTFKPVEGSAPDYARNAYALLDE